MNGYPLAVLMHLPVFCDAQGCTKFDFLDCVRRSNAVQMEKLCQRVRDGEIITLEEIPKQR